MEEEQNYFDEGQWEEYLGKIRIQNKEEANVLFGEIQQIIDATNPKDLLAVLTHMTYYIREDENIHENDLIFKLRDRPVIHFLAGLILQKKHHDLSKECISPELLFVLVNKCLTYFIKSSAFLNGDTKENLDKYFTIQQHKEAMRTIRPINPERYPHQTIHYLFELGKRITDVFKDKFGLTVQDFLNIGNQIKLYTVNRINTNLKDRSEQLKQVHIDNQDPEDLNDQYIEESDDNEMIMDENFYGRYLIGCAMKDLLFIDIEGLTKDYLLSPDEVIKFEKFLTLCSNAPGDQPEESDALIDNVLLAKPLIQWGSTYFCPAPADLVSALPVTLEKLLESDKLAKPPTRAWDRFQKAKANFVEDQAEEFFRRIFKKEHVYKNVKYDYNGNVEEADLLVPYDNKLIIVQAKSGSMSQAARRGAEHSLRNVIKKLIEEAYQQGLKVREYLENAPNPQFRLKDDSFAFAPRPGLSVKTEYIFINLTLEPLGALSARTKNLRSLGFLQGDEFPVSMSIFDLDVITDVLPRSPSIFIHYLKERVNSHNEDIFQLNDELTALSWYLDALSFRRPQGEDYQDVNFIGLDTDYIQVFDDYFLRKGKKPVLKLEDDWIRLIQFVEASNWLQHTEMCEKLLSLNADIRSGFIERIKRLEPKNHKNKSINLISLATHSHEIGISYLTSEGDRNDLIRALYSVCEIRKYQSKKDTWIGLAKIRRPNEPWWKTTAVQLLSYPWKFDIELERLSKDFPFQ